jgi:hypothetical protein
LAGKGWSQDDAEEGLRGVTNGLFRTLGIHFLCHRSDVDAVVIVSPTRAVLKEVTRDETSLDVPSGAPTGTAQSPAVDTALPPTVASSAARVHVDATALTDAYLEDSAAANAKYKGQRMVVSQFFVRGIDVDESGSPILRAGDKDDPVKRRAYIRASEVPKVAIMRPKQVAMTSVTLECTCEGPGPEGGAPVLRDCVVLGIQERDTWTSKDRTTYGSPGK